MLYDTLIDNRMLRDTAVRLIRCVGAKAALDYCRNHHWHGLYEQIELLSSATEHRA